MRLELGKISYTRYTHYTNVDSIMLTVEGESDFKTGMIPTLDFPLRVRDEWEGEFKCYEKPMSSGLVIQRGTALPK